MEFTKENILLVIEMILTFYKNFFKWLGITVLPDDGEWPYEEEEKDDPRQGA